MKRCPNCKRTFEDDLTYCLIDGAVLSAPLAEDADNVDSLATEVLPESGRTPAPTEHVAPPQTTMAAVFKPVPGPSPPELSSTQGAPVGLIGIIGFVTVLYSVAIVVLLLVKWEAVNSFFGWVLVRRTPVFVMAFIGIAVALIRIKHHVRASLLAVLALIIYVMEGLFFYLFNAAMIDGMAKMRLSPSLSEWLYVFIYFFEDFVFAAVIILLVTAAFKGRNNFSELTPEKS